METINMNEVFFFSISKQFFPEGYYYKVTFPSIRHEEAVHHDDEVVKRVEYTTLDGKGVKMTTYCKYVQRLDELTEAERVYLRMYIGEALEGLGNGS